LIPEHSLTEHTPIGIDNISDMTPKSNKTQARRNDILV